MIRPRTSIGRARAFLIALALLPLLPAAAPAETITFVNDTKAPLVVQMATAVRGGIRRDRPYPVAPGEKVRIALSGNKLLNVYDGRMPNRVLYQGTLPASTDDQAFSITPGKPDAFGQPRVTLDVVSPPAPDKETRRQGDKEPGK